MSYDDNFEVVVGQAITEFDQEAFQAEMSEIAKSNPGKFDKPEALEDYIKFTQRLILRI